MSQSDFTLDNQSGAGFRAELNAALQALASQSAGTLEPTIKYAYQIWLDTSGTGLVKRRNSSNTDWVVIGDLSATTGFDMKTGAGAPSGSGAYPWQMYLDTTNYRLYFWNNGSATWIQDGHPALTNNPHSVTAAQVNAVPITGGTMTGQLVLPTTTPSVAGHATPKTWVDTRFNSINFKEPVKAVKTTASDLNGPETIDTISVVAGDRVLLTGQTNKAQNGIQVVQNGAWTRPSDWTGSTTVKEGAVVFVALGVVNARSLWVVQTDPVGGGTITVDTDDVDFASQSLTGRFQEFATAGDSDTDFAPFTVPEGVTEIWVSALGAGGGGADLVGAAGGGGAGGKFIDRFKVAVTPGTQHRIVIGAGGAAGNWPTDSGAGTNGGSTKFYVGAAIHINATGGSKAPANGPGGAAVGFGSGAGAAGVTGQGGAGGYSAKGSGATGGTNSAAAGTPDGPGGGGGGSTHISFAPSAGADGWMMIEW